jgi:hypothetical protein
METAISMSDDLCLEAEQTDRQMNVSRSKLYSLALYEYLQTQPTISTEEAVEFTVLLID